MAGRRRRPNLTSAEKQAIVRSYFTRNPDGTWPGAPTVAAQHGVSTNAVYYIVSHSGHVCRSSKEAFVAGKQCRPIKNLPPLDEVPPVCRCGCGGTVAWNQRGNRWNAFVVGHLWPDKPYKSREWLFTEYVTKNRTQAEIALDFGVNGGVISRWLGLLEIPTRNPSAAHIGRQGGAKNPAWKGGVTPERQRLYKSQEWKALLKAAYRRDRHTCQRCGHAPKAQALRRLHAHHMAPWADAPHLRLELSNLVTLCNACHVWVHSRANVNGEFLREVQAA